MLGLVLLLTVSGSPHSIGEPMAGPDSASTGWVLERLKHWAASTSRERTDGTPLVLECLQTPDQPQTVGVRQEMIIAASLQEVAAVVDDFAHYAQLFPDLIDVHVVRGSQDTNRFLVSWEQHVPVFFIPNVTYETTYLVDSSVSGRISYRYKLKEKGTVKATDGLVVLEAVAPGRTRYTEVDFIEADFGPFSASTAWQLTVTGLFRSDVALKLKAEHAGWSYEKIRLEADRLLERYPIDACFEHRHPRQP